jgi:hypothetical protein
VSGEERRRSPRVAARCLVGYARRLDVRRFALLGVGTTIDVSEAGIRLIVHEAVLDRSRLELQLVLGGRPARIDEARVVRVKALPGGLYEVGARFEQVSRKTRATIAEYVEDNLARRAA